MTLNSRRIERLETTPSTMLIATQRAREGCPTGTIVIADAQTAGMGRHGRTWHSQSGSGLYASFVLRLGLPIHQLPVTMLALGLAVGDAIGQTSGLSPDLRWPNDVLLSSCKCAGVLAQLEGDAVIAGIGINVSQIDFPPDLDTPATSLLLEGARVSREDLLVALAHSIDFHCARVPDDILARFTAASSYARGRRVRTESLVEGVTQGLDPSGFLIVREDNGRETTILAGGVRPV